MGKETDGKGKRKGWEWEGNNRLGKCKGRERRERKGVLPCLVRPLHEICYILHWTRRHAWTCIAKRRNVLRMGCKVLITSSIQFHGIKDSSSSSSSSARDTGTFVAWVD